MKKLSKKQKLIGGIAILIVAVIVAIVITTSVIKNNNQVASEGYSVATANASSSLISNYILNGITIGGITGKMEVLDTSDATATAEDIVWGKTGYVNGEKITGTYDNSTLAQLKRSGQTVTENTIVEDRYDNQIKVPEGFKIAEDSPVTIAEGVVIEDSTAGDENTKGSQFVWIPVGDVYTSADHTEENKVTITLGRYTFDSTAGEKYGKATLVQSAENWEDTSSSVAISTYYKELASSTYGNEIAKNLEDFITKATTSHGYYIGRYEAGDATATNSARTSSTIDTNPIVCKTGVYPYNWITQPQASSLCQNMYSSDNFQSDLINSYAWDTAIVFIQEFSGDTNYSQQRGRNTARALQKCGESILDYNLDEGDVAQDIRCNIYDMAGNTWEWSTETCSYPHAPCVTRGGYYNNSTTDYTSVRGYGGTTNSGYGYGSCRPTLYL